MSHVGAYCLVVPLLLLSLPKPVHKLLLFFFLFQALMIKVMAIFKPKLLILLLFRVLKKIDYLRSLIQIKVTSISKVCSPYATFGTLKY